MNMTTKICEYCGNTSGKENQYGQCISCGGNLSEKIKDPIEAGKGRIWVGHTGSSYVLNLFGEVGKETFVPKPYWCYTQEWLDDWGEGVK